MNIINASTFWAQIPFILEQITGNRGLIGYLMAVGLLSVAALFISISITSKSFRTHVAFALFANFLFVMISLGHVGVSAEKLAAFEVPDEFYAHQRIGLQVIVVLGMIDSKFKSKFVYELCNERIRSEV